MATSEAFSRPVSVGPTVLVTTGFVAAGFVAAGLVTAGLVTAGFVAGFVVFDGVGFGVGAAYAADGIRPIPAARAEARTAAKWRAFFTV
ncbi:hypothetical protein Acsp01_59690 [Actinoplanes sp. NBRC 101535]|nr:hypothetical protein Acsp01_59690 [Actinoplanes sp. NBRC 101535]